MKFEEQYKELPGDVKNRRKYWEVAKGLQKVDGLRTSSYLEGVIEDTVNEKYDTVSAEEKIRSYYEELSFDSEDYQCKEADIVSARIALLLEQGGFSFSPGMLCGIHEELFRDVLPSDWVGKYRNVNLTKEEDVLNGQSVQYGNFSMIRTTLQYDFDEERRMRYVIPFTEKQIEQIVRFTSNIWKIHPFREGNTRTVATFLVLYLRDMGVEITNEPFRSYSSYFREALVRSNYSDIQSGIYSENRFLKMFFENLLLGAGHDLESEDLRCVPLFPQDKKQKRSDLEKPKLIL